MSSYTQSHMTQLKNQFENTLNNNQYAEIKNEVNNLYTKYTLIIENLHITFNQSKVTDNEKNKTVMNIVTQFTTNLNKLINQSQHNDSTQKTNSNCIIM